MKCLIFSDTHGKLENLKAAIAHHPDAEVAIFLGDGIRDAETASILTKGIKWFFVLGNCDFKTDVLGCKIAKTNEITLYKRKIVFTHGDLYGVKLGYDGLYNLAATWGADIVLFGHTHEPYENFVSIQGRGVYFFNPGSLSGEYGKKGSYGILTIDENSVLFSCGLI